MARERRLQILSKLAEDQAAGVPSKRLCETCAEVTKVTGAGIMLMAEDAPRGWLCTSDDVSALMEQLQYELGEGPCVDAYRLNQPVFEPDLAKPEEPRWLAFASPVVAAGVRAVFGFPLVVGGARLGALNLYRDEPGLLDDEQQADALVMADVAAEAILLRQSEAPYGVIAEQLEADADFQWVVHQAAGMVAAQTDEPVAQALMRLRAHAFGNNRRLGDVARDVVARTLRFNPDPDAG